MIKITLRKGDCMVRVLFGWEGYSNEKRVVIELHYDKRFFREGKANNSKN